MLAQDDGKFVFCLLPHGRTTHAQFSIDIFKIAANGDPYLKSMGHFDNEFLLRGELSVLSVSEVENLTFLNVITV